MHIVTVVGPYLGFVAVFSFVVAIHELGHFIAAKRCGVPVTEFSLGFPGTPIIWRFGQHKETLFTLRLLPFGGFVRFVDAHTDGDGHDVGDGVGEDIGGEQTFEALPPGKKIAILVAGGAVNLIVGFALLVVGIMGIKGLGLLDSLVMVTDVMKMIVSGTLHTITNFDISGVSGPVGAAVQSQKVMHSGLMPVVALTGLMSFAIGVMNLLPLPGCDGFYICLAAVEGVRGKSISRRTHAIFGAAGFAFLVLLMVTITYNDVVRILTGIGS
jgi:regulator of sigma E protease